MSSLSPERFSSGGFGIASGLPRAARSGNRGIRYSFVIPIFNEEAVLPFLLPKLDRVLGQLDGPAEVIFVDDGSRDDGPHLVRAHAEVDCRYRMIELSRNFGHQAAISAGMDHA